MPPPDARIWVGTGVPASIMRSSPSRSPKATPSRTARVRWRRSWVRVVSLGHAAWFGIAAYTLVLMAPKYDPANLWITLPAAVLAAAAAAVPAGSGGLLFLPYLSGERSPHPDPLARGAFVGLTLTHDLRHLTRAVLEGVAFGLRDGLDLMIDAGTPVPDQIRASGGGTESPLWRQILADVLGAEIATVSTSEGAAYGAGVLAAVGAGWYPSVEAASAALVTATPVASPGPDTEAYRDAHAIYRELYPALAPTFHRM